MTKFEELNGRTINWAKEKGILDKATPLSQHLKTEEECFEISEALIAQSKGEDTYINSKGRLCTTEEEVLDGLGDLPVTWLIQCKLQSIDPLVALEKALDIIEKRTGKMLNGQFVKDE